MQAIKHKMRKQKRKKWNTRVWAKIRKQGPVYCLFHLLQDCYILLYVKFFLAASWKTSNSFVLVFLDSQLNSNQYQASDLNQINHNESLQWFLISVGSVNIASPCIYTDSEKGVMACICLTHGSIDNYLWHSLFSSPQEGKYLSSTASGP